MAKKRKSKRDYKGWLLLAVVVFTLYYGDSKYTNYITPYVQDFFAKYTLDEKNEEKIDSSLSGKVIRVSDGDTVLFEDLSGKKHKIRLNGIDAPETSQEYGNESKAFLEQTVLNKQATVEVHGTDQYNRVLGVLIVDNTDINKKLLENGLAWQYRFNNDKEYATLVEKAKLHKKNIWSSTNPTDPYVWRKQNMKK